MDWKKKLTDAGILILVFIAAVIGFSLYTNKGNANVTADMGAATYPQISFSYNGYTMNTLNGYAKAMDIPVMRDVVTPVLDQKVVGMIETYDNQISSVEYIVYSLDGRQQLKNGLLNFLGEDFTLNFDDVGLTEERRRTKRSISIRGSRMRPIQVFWSVWIISVVFMRMPWGRWKEPE